MDASAHEFDALALAAWMQLADSAEELGAGQASWFTAPELELAESLPDRAETLMAEGWILGASLSASLGASPRPGP